MKLAESLSPITKKLDEVKESTEKLGENVKEDNTQLAIENTHNALPIENEQIQPRVVYDTSLENTFSNMKDNTGFFKSYSDPKHGWMWKGYPIKISSGTEVKINNKKVNITPGI